MKRFFKLFLTIFIGIVFGLLLAEAALRLMPGLVLPNKAIICKKNKEGFRDIDHKLKALQGVLRIVFIGDSYTKGWGVDNQQTFAVMTPKLLAARIKPRQVEGFNFGQGGPMSSLTCSS